MKRLLLLIAISLLCTSTLSIAGKIYKWTDSEGKTHYGARPPAGQGQQIRIPKAPTYAAKPAAKPGDSKDARKTLLDAFDKERKDKKEAAAKAKKIKATRDKGCSHARKAVANLKYGGRIYDISEQGERTYLEDDDIKKRLAAAQKTAEKWCEK